MSSLISRFFSVLFSLLLIAAAGGTGYGQDGYSRKATNLWDKIGGGFGSIVVSSPDGRSVVIAKGISDPKDYEHVILEIRGAIGKLVYDIGPGVASEVLWSPSSNSFFVTTSDGGANGFYRTIVFTEIAGHLEARDLSTFIYEKFGHPVRCDGGLQEPPNVGGIGWLGAEEHLLVAAEIVSHTVCDSPGTFRTYEIDISTGKLVRDYGQIESKRRFRALLGNELRNAPDGCIRHPRSCYIPNNHP